MSTSSAVRWTGVAIVLAGLTACASSPIPVAQNFELTSQYKVRSAGHWDLLARDVATQTLETLQRSGEGAGRPLYVTLPERASTFDRTFRDLLITKLVRSGRTVTTEPGQSLEVSYQAQVVRHNSQRPHHIPGQMTMITAGLYAIYGLHHEHRDVKAAGGLGLAMLADYLASENSGGPTHTEMILTTTVASGGRYLARKTDVYYVEEPDIGLFARAPGRDMKVVSE